MTPLLIWFIVGLVLLGAMWYGHTQYHVGMLNRRIDRLVEENSRWHRESDSKIRMLEYERNDAGLKALTLKAEVETTRKLLREQSDILYAVLRHLNLRWVDAQDFIPHLEKRGKK